MLSCIQDKFSSIHNIAQEITVLRLTSKRPEYMWKACIVLQLRLSSNKRERYYAKNKRSVYIKKTYPWLSRAFAISSPSSCNGLAPHTAAYVGRNSASRLL